MFCVLCGGVGAARFLLGAQAVYEADKLAAIVNCGDDIVLHGLHISPDIDTIIYTLSGRINPDTGWGLRDETWRAMGELRKLGGEAWFNLGDQDLATHLFRTELLSRGTTLTEITAALAQASGLEIAVLPMSEDRVETRIQIAEAAAFGDDDWDPTVAGREVGFQEYFVQLRHSVPVSQVRFAGADSARATPQVLAALQAADVVVIAPSNPVVSIGPLLALREIRQILRDRFSEGKPVVAISPLIAGRAIKGPADRLLTELGSEPSSLGIARFYEGLISTLIIDEADAAEAEAVEALGMSCVVTATDMSQPGVSAKLARLALGS